MSLETLSKDQEAGLVDSVVSAIKLTNEGMHPNEAIAKVAAAANYNRDFVGRMTEAFNVSKSIKHLKSASGDARAASFDIADPAVILSKLYPESVPTVTETKQAEWIPEGTSMSSERFFDLENTPVVSEKKEAVYTHDGTPPDILINRAYTALNAMERDTGIAKQAMADARESLGGKIHKLASYFRLSTHEPFANVEGAALQHFGDSVRPLMTAIYDASRREYFHEKRASGPSKVRYGDKTPYAILAEIVDARDTYVKAASAYFNAKTAQANFKSRLQLRCSLMRKMGKGTSALDLSIPGITSPWAQFAEPSEGESRPAKDMGDIAEEAQLEFLPDNFREEHRGIGAQVLLHKLLKTDPVLRSADPNSVVTLYNELARTAPTVVDSPLALKAYLRKGIESESFDPLELAAMLRMGADENKTRTSPRIDLSRQ